MTQAPHLIRQGKQRSRENVNLTRALAAMAALDASVAAGLPPVGVGAVR